MFKVVVMVVGVVVTLVLLVVMISFKRSGISHYHSRFWALWDVAYDGAIGH